MKKNFISIICMFLFFAGQHAFAQKKARSYATGYFKLSLENEQGFLTPIKQGDTLTYTLRKLSDSSIIEEKFYSKYGSKIKKYYLKYRLKKRDPKF